MTERDRCSSGRPGPGDAGDGQAVLSPSTREGTGPVPATGGVLEVALYVHDLDRAEEFYRVLFGWATIAGDERFRALRLPGAQVLLLFLTGASSEPMEAGGGTIPPHGARGSQHVAFKVAAGALGAWRRRLAAQGVAIESEVQWPDGGRSLYFRDADGHSLELVTPGCWSATY